ncbi:RCC1 and BTB domain-containing protein 1 [Trachymyrmex zeteki]|uniref:RCC1 and BTB domain-containing protein 1 n=1 Tax=Mycetomoellerius zeteki TaxID=64791 RepID=A0A151WGU6_9HYME|nr:RCC1 and BTB domain-containing protein 1 [Trachymyrmex zeteki]
MVNIANVKKVSDIAALKTKSFVKCSEDGLVYILGYFAKTFIKKPLVCEYTNVFNVCDSMTAYSPISVTHEFTNDELDILNDLETAFNDRLTSDLAIEVEEQSIYVHKTILKMRCTYFRNMFQTDYIESKQRYVFTKKKCIFY